MDIDESINQEERDEIADTMDEIHNGYGKLLEENKKLRAALGAATYVIASVVACCSYKTEEEAKIGAYAISHEAFTKIDQFIREYSDILKIGKVV